jgi:hypothetical protein
MVRANRGLVPTRCLCGALHLRHLRFQFFLLTLGARKGRMALRAERRHRRSSASTVVRFKWRRAAGLWAGRDGKGPVGRRGRAFLRNCATTPASAGAGSFRRVRPGRRHDPGEGSTQVAVASVFAKLRNDPPAGAGSFRRVRPGRGHDPGEGSTQVAVASVLAKLRNDPPAGAGSFRRVRPGRATTQGKDRHRLRWPRFLRNCATTRPTGQAPSVGSDPGGATTQRKDRHRSRWSRFLRNCATTLASAGAGSSCWVRPGRERNPGKDGHRSRRTGFRETRNDPRSSAPRTCPVQRSAARLRPGGHQPRSGWGAVAPAGADRRLGVGHGGEDGGGGRVFAKPRHDPSGKCSRACPMQLSASQSMLLVSPIGGPAHRGPGGSEWNTSPLSDRGPDPL